MPSSSSSSDLPVGTSRAAESTTTVDTATFNRPWSRATTALLLLVGIAMGVVGFATVMSMGDMAWHGARDAELRATYDAYQDTGTLLIKETGSGSYGVQAPADGPLTFATWDDDPGSYIIASLMYNITGSDSPYPGLKLAQALFVAIPLVWLPLAVARIVGRARAGYSLVFLPFVVWLFNHGATLAGTEYGLSDQVSTLAVYSLYGTAASLAFLSLSLIVLLSAYRLKLVALIGATVGIAVLAAFGNMSRSLSGMGIAAAVGVLWWLFARRRWRWVSALAGAVVTILLASVLQTGLMTAINVERANTTGQAMTEVPDAHTAWHSLYLGLSYPTPINGQPSHFAVTWADEYGWAKAREVNPDVLVASEEYDEILKGLYLDQVLGDPVGAVKLYLKKALFVTKHFGGLILFIIIGFAVGMSVRARQRPRLGRVLAIATPLFLLGLVPAILVMPMLYYYSELAAALGLLAAVSLGVLVWAVTSWPARVRGRELRRRLRETSAAERVAGLSVVLDGFQTDRSNVDALTAVLAAEDELIISMSDGDAVESRGRQLREAVLRTRGDRVLIVGDAPLSDAGESVAAARSGMDASPGMVSEGRASRDSLIRSLTLGDRVVGRPRTFALDGNTARFVAGASKESSDLWFDEMLFAASVNQNAGVTLLDADASHAKHSRPFRELAGFVRIALRREEYVSTSPR
ncbi:hypothetical protein [Microbacterium sp.]|uniref:hypothetical protein n=1 Tax=Microbacterium sp. TaxID=51671 RepID=UPI003F9D5263